MIMHQTSALNLFFLAALVVWLGLSVTSEAAEPPGADYVLSIVPNKAFGDSVKRGDFEDAIRRIRFVDSAYPYPANTNLCVAHIQLGQYEKAQPHCEKALALALEAAQSSRRKDLDYRAERSAALNNRGALRALGGDPEGAKADFREALALNVDTAAPEINLRQLQRVQAASLAGN